MFTSRVEGALKLSTVNRFEFLRATVSSEYTPQGVFSGSIDYANSRSVLTVLGNWSGSELRQRMEKLTNHTGKWAGGSVEAPEYYLAPSAERSLRQLVTAMTMLLGRFAPVEDPVQYLFTQNPGGDSIDFVLEEVNDKLFAVRYGIDKPAGRNYAELLRQSDLTKSVEFKSDKLKFTLTNRADKDLRTSLEELVNLYPN